jgi:thiopurine S-methyltransferase
MNRFNRNYWENKYKKQSTGWDIGKISTPIKEYIDQLKNKELKILIPGAGNSYEAEYLWEKGFRNVFIIDIVKQPLINLKNRVPYFPTNQLINKDFFKYDEKFDLIIEQTFFCALDPYLRPSYANKMNELLNEKGKLIGLLFDFELTENGPPFGGDKLEYLGYFSNLFNIIILERAYNSILPRKDRELFFIFEKK